MGMGIGMPVGMDLASCGWRYQQGRDRKGCEAFLF